MNKIFFTLAFAALACLGTQASAATPKWLGDVSISPDGTEIAFCYKGDIYKVAANGGIAQRLTSRNSYESAPVWSPDGSLIAFASDRHSSFDVFVMPSAGGSATRLTLTSIKETPTAFSQDGKYVYYTAALQQPAQSILSPRGKFTELYRIPVTGGRSIQVLANPVENVCFSADGSKMYYHDKKGSENEWRKHHTSSVTRDIWVYDTHAGRHTNLTDRAGEDRSPVLSEDGKTLYFLSERDGGSFNVYRSDVSDLSAAEAVTSFSSHPVRFLSRGGNTLCYSYDGDIYTQAIGGQPRKVAIDIVTDEGEDTGYSTVTRGASGAVASPDGKQIAFIVRGEVFVTSVEYGTTKQITHTAEAERGLTFGADNRSLVYSSDRDGKRQLVMAKIVRDEDPDFPNATLIEEEILLPSDSIERAYPDFSPDGKELAFIQDRRKLMVMNMASKKVRQITDGSTNPEYTGGFGFEWSPDGKWFTLEFTANRHHPYYDIGIVSAKGGGEVVNITNSGYFCMSPRFVMDGNAILFHTDRYGMRAHASWGSQEDAMMVFLNQDAYDKYRLSEEDYNLLKELEKENKKGSDKKKDKEVSVELDGIQDRIVRLTPSSGDLGDAIVTPDGGTLYYFSSHETGRALWKRDLRKGDIKMVQEMSGSYFQMAGDGKSIFIMGSSLTKMDIPSGKMTPIRYSAGMRTDYAKEREYMFDYVVREEGKRFYNTNMHGVDWAALSEHYRAFLPYIGNNYDFSRMLSEMLGELNVSHTGSGYRKSASASETTASLGLLYDMSWTGKGAKVDEVIEKGPFSNAGSKMSAGMIINKIDGIEITEDTDIRSLLTAKIGKKTLVSFSNPKSGKRYEEVVLPISRGVEADYLYERWIKQRAADVERWSGGRLGYVHLTSMDDESFRNVYSDILGKYNLCEGIVIDTRFNGGGRLHEDIEVLFSGKKYFTQVIRGEEVCDMPSRRWNKPSIMVVGEANYSNAHGTPWVYKHRNIGKIVGMPVPGTMTSVNWVTLQDPSLYFGIPVVGYRLPDGSYLENAQLEPDVKVANSPEAVAAGEDTQLKVAVEELLKAL